ncbi:hypothetical protein GW17_00028230 [Ensete ventricosum]|nr:hypothetical protein GW17_00028230 [Ensete ventricosum]
MLFELRNIGTERVSHCGVLEFIAQEGMIYMPYWVVQDAQDEAEEGHRFTPFTGVGRRLDGKPLNDQAPTITSSSVKDQKSEAVNSTKQSTPSTSQSSSSRQNMGRLVFGSNSSRASREAQKDSPKEKKEEAARNEEPKFQPFTGKKYSLRD